MSPRRTPAPADTSALFVRLPAAEARKLDRAAHAVGAAKKDLVAGLVVAGHAEQAGVGAQGRRIARHVGGAAQALLAAFDAHHRHRRFRRDARDVAEPVAVEHDVAHHQHARPRDATAIHKPVYAAAVAARWIGRPIGT